MRNDENLKSIVNMLDGLDSISYEAIDSAYQEIVKIEHEHDNEVHRWFRDSTLTSNRYDKLWSSSIKRDLERKRPLFNLIYSICKKNNLSFGLAIACMAHKHHWKVDSARYIYKIKQ